MKLLWGYPEGCPFCTCSQFLRSRRRGLSGLLLRAAFADAYRCTKCGQRFATLPRSRLRKLGPHVQRVLLWAVVIVTFFVLAWTMLSGVNELRWFGLLPRRASP